GVQPRQLVGICLERSLDMVVGLLAIWKAGAAYLPLDPDYPAARLEHMLQDSRAPHVLTQHSLQARLQPLLPEGGQTLCVDDPWQPGQPLEPGFPSPEDLAYVIYTSGSTGKPKGVMVGHRGLTNFLAAMAALPGLAPTDRLLALTTLSFDIAALELYLPLVQGAHCVLASAAQARDPKLLMAEIRRVRPSVMQATPATWRMLFNSGWKNEERVQILCGGEALPEALKQHFIVSDSEAWNLFGPTETTVWSTIARVTADKPVSIGSPIANTQVYVLDAHGEPVPVGVPGELYIGGDGVAHGYLQRPELTQERFIDDPFCKGEGRKLYRTGDRVRWREDGQLDYLERMDQQVKVRGYRIELGEIESRLGEQPGVQSAVVVVRENEGVRQLVAYCTGQRLEPKSLRKGLQQTLPEYMVPAHVVVVADLPLTPSGKVDRLALAARAVGQSVQAAPARAAPGAQSLKTEARMLQLWSEVLGVPVVEPGQGFFDSGGDSMLAMTLAQRIELVFGCEFSVTDVFRHGTARAMARHVVATAGQADLSATDHPDPGVPADPGSACDPDTPASSSHLDHSLAIIGISCQFPGAANYREFWDNLRSGTESLRMLDEQELRDLGVPETLSRQRNFVPVHAGIDGRDLFDPAFFKLSPHQARLMNPQTRLLLQHAWNAMEDAAYSPEDIPDTGVFVACSHNGYLSDQAPDLSSNDSYMAWLMSQAGTTPTLIAHRLGLTGPSYAVHSNCSSSLVALHAAFQAIRSGDATHALVGAATVFTQELAGYIHQKGMNFSSTGHVQTFDAQADGMVGSEGVAVLLVKRASQAVRDGDHIYALVRGIAINNDGDDKAGFYAPSVRGQGEVIEKALRSADMDVETIGCIEAHGTGTELGDPIEVSALKDVYGRYTARKNYCALGSVKTNIGHTDTAAGMAGCIKLALGLEHGEIAPSLNFRTPNPALGLAESPFFVADAPRAWPTFKGAPRRGALSSFGIGGTNAHAVLEAAPAASASVAARGPFLVPLSARDTDRLRERAQAMLDYLATPAAAKTSLADVAYTLQVGRKAMAARLACVVASADELRTTLHAWLEGGASAQVHQGDANKAQGQFQAFESDEDLQTAVASWVTKGRLDQLARFWTQGLSFDWSRLHGTATPSRVSLPGYPFAKERHWAQGTPATGSAAGLAPVSALHPLVHANTSDLGGQRYSSTFSGDEFFFKDHVVQGRKVLPGVAQVEMAHHAVLRATGADAHDVRLEGVVFARPIVAGDAGLGLHIALEEVDEDRIAYEIHSGEGEQEVVHGRGHARLGLAGEAPRLDLPALRAQCRSSLAIEDAYRGFEQGGLSYGPAFRGLSSLQAGHDDAGDAFALAEAALTPAVSGSQGDYGLHPVLLDVALQAGIGLALLADGADAKPTLPFAIERVQVHAPLPEKIVVVVRHTSGSSADSAVRKLDVSIADGSGRVCVELGGYSSRAAGALHERQLTTLMLVPEWQSEARAPGEARTWHERHVFVHAAHGSLRVPGATVHTWRQEGDAVHSQTEQALQLMQHLQALMTARPQGPVLVQIVVSVQEDSTAPAGLGALLRSAGQENPLIVGQELQIEPQVGTEALAKLLQDEASLAAPQVRYASGVRQTLRLADCPAQEPQALAREGGRYLVTGGAGGLGLLLTAELVGQARNLTLFLTGRSPLDDERRAQLAALQATGARVEYLAVDASDAAAVSTLVEEIRVDHGDLHGVFHAAGLLKDGLLLNKAQDAFLQVLAPKIQGLVNLDIATADMALDHFVAFSSMAAVTGNVGQADYAAANAYMDDYLQQRARRAERGERHGRSLSVNWPLWAEGGMAMDASTREMMWKTLGVAPLQTPTALQALALALGSNTAQVLVFSGDEQRIRASFQTQRDATAPAHSRAPQPAPQERALAAVPPAPPADGDALKGKAARHLAELLGAKLGTQPQRIDPRAPFEQYGIDSIMVVELTRLLEEGFGPLAKTLFYEYQNLDSLAGYFVQHHGAQLAARLGGDTGSSAVAPAPAPAAAAVPPAETARPRPRRVRRQAEARASAPSRAGEPLDIAIIGIDGRYPQANTLDEYWHNLSHGVNSITEIPRERWDHSPYFNPDKGAPNSTYAKWGGFIDGVDRFDPLFFNISPGEAVILDPQERLFLQCAHGVLEDAGYTRERLAQRHRAASGGASVGVFVGVMYEEYQLWGAQAQMLGHHQLLAGSPSSIANRVSYWCNFQGPSMAVDTMCSSSLTAIHLACGSVARGDCDVALAGGVNVSIHPNKYLLLSLGRYASSEGLCRSFGAGGDGYVPGEGVGAVLLKPLHKAIEDGDRIHGVIKGSSVNHGGKTNGFSVPSPVAQGDLIARAIRQSGVNPRTISYVEAHGTGTSLGDPIEIAGLAKAYGASTQDVQYCAIGSAKSNIGHCESAAGIAGLTKVLLQMRHGKITKSLHSQELNPNIDFAKTPFVVQQETGPWQRPTVEGREWPRIAGLSSFGAGGSNAHLVIEEYRAPAPARFSSAQPQIVVLSARDEERLKVHAAQVRSALERHDDAALGDIAHTLQIGREAKEERLACVVHTLQELKDGLDAYAQGRSSGQLRTGNARREKDALADFAGDDEFEGTVGRWMATGKLDKLAGLWVKGQPIDWLRLPRGSRPTLVSLPGYPFAQERYWYDLPREPRQVIAPPARSTAFVVKEWAPASAAPSGTAVQGQVLILAGEDTAELARQVQRRLPSARVLDREALAGGVAAASIDWDSCPGLIDLLGCADHDASDLAWLELVQRLVVERPRSPVRLLGVTSGLEARGDAPSSLLGAERAALYRMLRSEYSRADSCHLDLDPAEPPAAHAEQIVAEFTAQGDVAEVSMLGGRRHVAELREHAAQPSSDAPLPFDPAQVLWVTGGTRGLGLLCARHFVRRHGVRRLVLAGREAFPARGQWAGHLQAGDAWAEKIRAVQQLEAEGVQVHVSSVDLGDLEALRAELRIVHRELGAIGGLIHSAGLVDADTPAFVQKPRATVARVLHPKVQGLQNLLRELADEPLRFGVLFSSVSTAIPALGAAQSDYAMANGHMDYAAQARVHG
ncbi:MAG: amino acid adenylation domain-containing protein, partial [Rhizobacter sp.]